MLGKRLRPDAEDVGERRSSPKRHQLESPPNASSSKSSEGLPIPSYYLVTGWVSSEISQRLPPLPYLDPKLEREVFTHPAFGQPHYERLEWLGDSYLEQIATCLIIQTFERLPSGRCSQIREQLVRNRTLADYFQQYGMASKARLPKDLSNRTDLGRGSSADKDLLKTRGDMFEAFVAGAILSDPKDGLRNTTEWLKALWGRTILDQIQKAERQTSDALANSQTQEADGEASENPPQSRPELPPKQQLANKIVAPGIKLRYGDLPNNKKDKKLGLPMFTIGVYLEGWGEHGKLLATGSALQKKEAGQNAAAAALQDKKLMKLYGGKKQAFMAARAAAEGETQSTGEEGEVVEAHS